MKLYVYVVAVYQVDSEIVTGVCSTLDTALQIIQKTELNYDKSWIKEIYEYEIDTYYQHGGRYIAL